MQEEMNPFDIVSGKVAINHHGEFWFKDAGCNTYADGYPIAHRLHREDGPACVYYDPPEAWLGVNEPMWFLNGMQYRKKEFDEELANMYEIRQRSGSI